MNITRHLNTVTDNENPIKLVSPSLDYVDDLYQAITCPSPQHFQFLNWAYRGVTNVSVMENQNVALRYHFQLEARLKYHRVNPDGTLIFSQTH